MRIKSVSVTKKPAGLFIQHPPNYMSAQSSIAIVLFQLLLDIF